jgi:hypothetical protein
MMRWLLGGAVLWLAACDNSSASGPRHFVDAFGNHCTEELRISQPTPACQELQVGYGPLASCQGTPKPMPSCADASACWLVYPFTTTNPSVVPIGGNPPLPDGGSTATLATVCAGCCPPGEDGGDTVDITTCAAIPCKSASDCPFESCHCVGGWCDGI